MAHADGDPVEGTSDGFFNEVTEAQGVVLRVPVNAAGEENTSLAEMRLHTEGMIVEEGSNALEQAWEESLSLEGMNTLGDQQINDVSTRGWYNYRNNGYRSAYYYYNYRPYYRNYNRYYNNYYRPYTYTSYRNPYYYGYRYYYYPSYY
jgi:hypothetical protein